MVHVWVLVCGGGYMGVRIRELRVREIQLQLRIGVWAGRVGNVRTTSSTSAQGHC